MGSTAESELTVGEDLAKLYDVEYVGMVRLARLVTGSQELAEEAVHDAFVTVFQRWTTIDRPGAYLRRVVVNNCRTVQRRRRTERLKTETLARQETETLQLPEELDETWKALGVLSQRQRTALVLRYYEDLTVDGIAQVMGERPGSVKSLLHRGLARLRRELAT